MKIILFLAGDAVSFSAQACLLELEDVSPDSEDDEGFTVFTKKKKGEKSKSQSSSVWLQSKVPLAYEETKNPYQRYLQSSFLPPPPKNLLLPFEKKLFIQFTKIL